MAESKEQSLPHVPLALLKYLERLFPTRTPSIDQSDREIFFYAGKRSVVDLLFRIRSQEELIKLERDNNQEQ